MTIDWVTLTVGLVIGWIVGSVATACIIALLMATREEQQKTGHDGPVSGVPRVYR